MMRQFPLGHSLLSRRALMVSVGSAAALSPVGAFAQPAAMPVIGLLDSATSTVAELADLYAGLKVEGYVPNQTLAVTYHSAAGDYGKLPALAADLLGRRVAAIVAIGVPAALAAKAATTTIPIIFAIGPDPVRNALIGSLDRPGSNITGVTDLAVGRERKRLELLHELIPTADEIALLLNSNNPNVEVQSRDAVAAAGGMGVRLRVTRASADDEFDGAFSSLAASQPHGLVIADDELFNSRSAYLAFLALHHRLPAVFQGRTFTAAGGLVSYGANLTETYHQAGVYSGMVLKGAIAGDLPVFRSTRIEFIVNTRTSKSLGITIPPAMLSTANEVIR
jgi:putative tryptophan/tyrosine transport system substrate-binding protein